MGKGSFSLVKWLLTFFNFIFLIFGLGICGIGIWMFVSPSMSYDIMGQNLTPIVAYILLGSGGTIILISFCGCAGAGLENRCLLCLFFTVLCGIFVACLVAGILISIFRKDLTSLTSERLTKSLISNYGENMAWTEFWDFLQYNFSCCAVEDNKAIMTYQKTPWYVSAKPEKIPKTCCIKSKKGVFENLELCQKGSLSSMYNNGCMTTLMDNLIREYIIVLSVLVSLAVVLVFGMVLSLVHLRNIINVRYRDYSLPT